MFESITYFSLYGFVGELKKFICMQYVKREKGDGKITKSFARVHASTGFFPIILRHLKLTVIRSFKLNSIN